MFILITSSVWQSLCHDKKYDMMSESYLKEIIILVLFGISFDVQCKNL
jgi:hypothetical protein